MIYLFSAVIGLAMAGALAAGYVWLCVLLGMVLLGAVINETQKDHKAELMQRIDEFEARLCPEPMETDVEE